MLHIYTPHPPKKSESQWYPNVSWGIEMERQCQTDWEYMLNVTARNVLLAHFSPVSHFYTPWKRQKTFGDTGLK